MSHTRHDASTAMSGGHHPTDRSVGAAVTVRRAVTSELIKLRTLRSQGWVLAVATAFTAALGPVQSLDVLFDGAGGIDSSAAVVALALTGASTGCLLVGVLGVLVVAGEYAPRAIRTTFMLVPRRGHVVAAKAVALAVVVGASSALAVAVAVTATLAVLARADVHVGLEEPPLLRISVAMVWYLVGWGILGQAAGWLTRSKIGGATLLMTVMVVLTPVLGLIPGRAGEILVSLTPSAVGGAMISSHPTSTLGTPLVGLVLWSVYLVLLTAASAWVVARRDA